MTPLAARSGDMKSAVALPEGEDENEWFAVHSEWAHALWGAVMVGVPPPPHVSTSRAAAAVDFYNEVSLLYGTVSDFCKPDCCPTMSAGPKCVLLLQGGRGGGGGRAVL